MSIDSKRCFVIMPFSKTSKTHTKEYWNKHFENFLKPLIESCGNIEAFRSEPLRQDIIRQIVNDLVFSPIVVADLTDKNPNVYWELGVRQSFRHGTITIADKRSKIAFDVATKGILFYSSDLKEDSFSEMFRKAILDCISKPDRPDSLVLETITGRGSIYAVIHRAELIQRIEGLASENEMNMEILNQIIDQINKNKGNKLAFIKGKKTIIVHMSSSAIDKLLAERYLEEDSEFYKSIHLLSTMISAVNHQLANWDYSSSKNTEKYFLDNQYLFRSLLEQHQRRIVACREKLLSTF